MSCAGCTTTTSIEVYVCVCVVLSSQSQALPRYPLYTMTHRTNTVFSSSVCKHLVPSNLYHAVCIIMPCAISCRVYHHAVCNIMPFAISWRVQYHAVRNIMPCANTSCPPPNIMPLPVAFYLTPYATQTPTSTRSAPDQTSRTPRP